MLTLLFILAISWFRKRQLCRELKWQTMLLKNGIGYRTRIKSFTVSSTSLNGYRKIHIEGMVRVNGKTVCQKMRTLISVNEVLSIGDKVLIRYRPGHATHVMIAGRVQ